MKKFLASCLLSAFVLGFNVVPAFAILENNKAINKTSILDYINYDKWKKKNDFYLEGYIIRAIEKNADIKTAELKIEQAKQNVTLARSNMMPSIGVSASPAVNKMPSDTKTQGTFALPIYASWELDLFGKNWDKTKSSKKIMESVKYQAQGADISVISMVATVYYNIVNLDKQIEIQEQLVKDRAEIYRLMKLSNAEGLVSSSDLIRSEKSYVLSQNDLINLKKSRQNALNALAVLIGDSANNTGEYKRISLDKLDDNFNVPNEINSEIIVSRPDYKAIEKQLEAAGFDLRAAKKEFLPSINILGMLSFMSTSLASSMNWANALAFLGGGVGLPLFTGLKRVANVKLNKNKYEQLLQNYEKTNLVAIQEVNDSLYNYKSDKEKYLNNVKAYDIQKKDFELSKEKYNKGVISKLDLLQQQETLYYIKQLKASSKADCYIDEISLYKATGAKI